MSFKAKVISLSAAGVVLLGLFFLGGALSPAGSALRASRALLFPGLRPADVRRIELHDSSSIVLTRRSGAWRLKESTRDLPASEGRVEELVHEVAALARGSLVTRNPAAAASLGIGGSGSTRLVLEDGVGRALAELETGNPGPAGHGIYVRASSAPEVWLTGETLAPYLVTDRRFWADLRVLPRNVTDDMVMRLTVEAGSAAAAAPARFSWTVTREKDPRYGGQWSASAGISGKIRQDRVDAVVGSLAGLVAVDFAPADARARILARPVARITVSLTDNRTFVLLLGEPDGQGNYPCTLQEGTLSWLVPKWREQELVASPGEITGGSR